MPYDAAATRARLVEAAYAEFVERGLAGARVDRIAAQAKANKQAIYAYFGSKVGLFEAVLSQHLAPLADAVPFQPDDLPAYALATFDFLLHDPRVVRLALWARLERPDAAGAQPDAYREKAEALLAARPGLGSLDRALDAIALTLSMAGTWARAAPALLDVPGTGRAARQRDHRAALAAAVRGAVDALAADR